MVLGRRFKLYFILCVWDRMSQPTTPPASYANNGNQPKAIQSQNNTPSANKLYGNLSSFKFNPNALKHMQPIGNKSTHSYGPVKTSQIPSIKKTPYNRPASKPAIPQYLSFVKDLIHPGYIESTDIEWYKNISTNNENKIKFLQLFLIQFNNTCNSNFHNETRITNHDIKKARYQLVFSLAKNEYEKLIAKEPIEQSFQPPKTSTPGGARRGNKKQQKHRTRRNRKHRKHRTRKH